ncbi:hypothetical protein ACFXDE_04805 [Kitasatospora sp. NPDC059408]|uniref:hypothetical protein n=1 Tax=Kitasatospora sp. NPDC059408 TaxID=3346823 RepID=UPI0036912FD4
MGDPQGAAPLQRNNPVAGITTGLRVAMNGDEADRIAVATGFFESLLNAWDDGFGLASVRPAVGPESRAYCRAWNDFGGIESPAWM